MADQQPSTDPGPTGPEIAALEVESLEGARSMITLTGHWRGDPQPRDARAILIVDAPDGRRRFSAIPGSSDAPSEDETQFAARFTVPTKLVPELARGGSLAVGELVVGLGNIAEPPETQPQGSPAEELLRRAASEARLRGEVTELKARLAARSAAESRMEEMREELRVELQQVRELIGREDARRAETESRAMVLAAELAEAQQQVRELGEQLSSAREDAEAAQAIARAAEAEVAGLGAELERLEHKLASSQAELDQQQSGLQEAESLLVEARELNALLRDR